MFGRRIKQLREAKGWTQEELAERSGVSAQAVSHYETGRRSPLFSTAVHLAAALGCPVTDLLQDPTPVAAEKEAVA